MAKIKLSDVVTIDARFNDVTVSGIFGPGEVDVLDEVADMLVAQGLAEPVKARRTTRASDEPEPDNPATKE